MASAAKQLGVSPARILTEPRAKDTYTEAKYIAEKVGDKPFLLVTDASHMRRSVALFRGQGAEPIPMPTNYRGWDGPVDWHNLFPDSSGVEKAERLWWEILGYHWARFRGQLKTH